MENENGRMTVRQAYKECVKLQEKFGSKFVDQRFTAKISKRELIIERIEMRDTEDWAKRDIKTKTQKDEVIQRETHEQWVEIENLKKDRDMAQLNASLAGSWAKYFLEIYSQEGDIDCDIDEEEQVQLMMEWK